jgi:CheY-like chemotaxis protein
MLPNIFNLYVQVPSSLQRSQGGLGVGLTLVKNLVEMHGGTIEAHSAGPRQGSEFIVHLPLAPEGCTDLRQGLSAAESPTRNRLAALRVLVVDDNRDAADSLALLLRLAGYEVQVAYTGSDALEAVRSFQPQVLLQDLQMPDMSGYDVARRLREQPAAKKVVLVAVSGHGSEGDRRRSLEAGFDHHLVKPVDLYALQQVLASLVSFG